MSKLQTSSAQSGKSKQSGSASKKSKSRLLIVIVVVILVLVTAGIIVFMLNLGNLRETVLSFVLPQAATDKEADEQEILEAQIRDEILRLSAIEDELDSRENQLNLRESEITSKEEELKRIMQENINISEQLSPRFDSVLSVAKMYGNMEPEQAALILSAMTNQEQVMLILKSMDEEKAGEILGLMEPGIAAGHIERMMPQYQQ